MFERFTERARQVVVLAQDEARSLGHGYVGTEHLLLGLLREEEGIAARVLIAEGITLDRARTEVTKVVAPGEASDLGQIPFTPRAKKVLELSLREAIRLGHSWIGTEHLLLGLVREDGGVASRVLETLGTDGRSVADHVGAVLGVTDPTFGSWRPAGGGQVMHARTFTASPRRRWRGRGRDVVAGWMLGAGTLGLGIFVGWLIWG